MSEGSASPAALSTPAARRPVLLLAFLILIAVGLFWPSISALAELWSDPARRTYQHGYLIAAIVLWLLFRTRHRIAAAAGRPAPVLLFAATIGGLAWAVAWNAGLQVIHFLLWPAILLAAAAGALGWKAGRVLLLPIGYLYFAMPIWDALTPALQTATVFANRVFAALAGVPVVIDGNYIHIPEGSFEIAGGCSGLNYLVVGLAISALLGELNRDNLNRRILLVALGGALALFSNWIRVFVIIYAGHVSNMTHYLVRVDHYNFGWVLFAFVLAAFFLVVRRLPIATEPDRDEPAPPEYRGLRTVPVVTAVIAIALGPLLARGAGLSDPQDRSDSLSVGVQHLELDRAKEWQAGPAIGDWIPVFPGAHAESLVDFSRGEDRISVYTATYLRQSQGRELIGHESRVQGAGRGRFTRSGRQTAATEPPIEVVEAEWLDEGGERALLWWTYQVGARHYASGLPAQLWYGMASLWSAPISSIVILRGACGPDCGQARQVLTRFSSDALPELLAAAGNSGEPIQRVNAP